VGSFVAAETPTKQGIEIEHEEALQIQRSLLPAGPLFGQSFEVAYRFLPYGEVGGDFADFFNLPDGMTGIYVGDVVGKGLPAAMYAALVMGMMRGIHKTGVDTAGALALLNQRMIVRPVPGRYAATLYAIYDPAARRLTFSNAGLPQPVLVSATGCQRLGSGGFPSGLFPTATYDLHSIELSPGDAVLFATDGLHELRDANDADFSWDRLAEIWAHCRAIPAKDSLERLIDGAQSFARNGYQCDDITAVVLKVT
jgi:phosphoserine phosphatase RsbU/P